jgi:hypothetical protein
MVLIETIEAEEEGMSLEEEECSFGEERRER